MKRLVRLLSDPYTIATVSCLCVLFPLIVLRPVLHSQAPLLIFLVVVMAIARYFGFKAGIYTSILSCWVSYLFVYPAYRNHFLANADYMWVNAVYMVVGFGISWISEAWHIEQRRVKQEQDKLLCILEAMANGVIMIAPSGYVTFANRAASRMFGLLQSHMVGRLINDAGWRMYDPDGFVLKDEDRPFYQVLRNGVSVRMNEAVLEKAGGKFALVSINAAPILNTKGEIVGVVESMQEIAPRRSVFEPAQELSSSDGEPAEIPVRSDAIDPSLTFTRPIRVLYVDHVSKLSGGEIALLRLLESIDRKRVEPIAVLGEEGPLVEKLRSAGVKTEVMPLDNKVRNVRKDSLSLSGLGHVGRILALIKYAVKVSRFAKRHMVDIIHTNSLKSDLYGGMAGLLARIPVVWHVRDNIDPTYLPAPAAIGFRALANLIPTYVVTNSQSTLDTLGLASRHPTAVVPSGIDLNPLVIADGLTRAELLGIANDGEVKDWPKPTRIGIVGRLAPWKGQHVFIAAAGQILRDGFDTDFSIIGSVMFGEDVYEEQLRDQVKELGIADRVTFHGFCSDIPAMLRQLQILVHASTSPEPFGQVVAEGMAEGLPVIGSDGGGVREIIIDEVNGLLVPMGDVNALVKAIEELLGDPAKAQRLARAGYSHIRRHFTSDRTARKVEKVYHDILASGR